MANWVAGVGRLSSWLLGRDWEVVFGSLGELVANWVAGVGRLSSWLLGRDWEVVFGSLGELVMANWVAGVGRLSSWLLGRDWEAHFGLLGAGIVVYYAKSCILASSSAEALAFLALLSCSTSFLAAYANTDKYT